MQRDPVMALKVYEIRRRGVSAAAMGAQMAQYTGGFISKDTLRAMMHLGGV